MGILDRVRGGGKSHEPSPPRSGEEITPECIDVQPRMFSTPQPWWLSEDEFYDVADEAYENLPREFSHGIDNVAIEILPEPQDEHRRKLLPGHELLGLYVGVSKDRRAGGYGYLNAPDTIYLYSGPIHRVSHSEIELREQIRKTLWHEIGHYHGMSDAELHAVGY